MTPEQYTPKEHPYENEKALQQIRRSIHSIENKLEHLAEKLELCLETFAKKEENGLTEADLYPTELDEYDW